MTKIKSFWTKSKIFKKYNQRLKSSSFVDLTCLPIKRIFYSKSHFSSALYFYSRLERRKRSFLYLRFISKKRYYKKRSWNLKCGTTLSRLDFLSKFWMTLNTLKNLHKNIWYKLPNLIFLKIGFNNCFIGLIFNYNLNKLIKQIFLFWK